MIYKKVRVKLILEKRAMKMNVLNLVSHGKVLQGSYKFLDQVNHYKLLKTIDFVIISVSY